MHVHAPGSFCLRSVSCSISYPSLPLKFVQVFYCLLVPLNSQISSSSSALPNVRCVSSLLKPSLALFCLVSLVLLPSVVFDSQPLPLSVFPQAGFSEKAYLIMLPPHPFPGNLEALWPILHKFDRSKELGNKRVPASLVKSR